MTIYFKPWIGANFKDQACSPVRMLLMAEAHYDERQPDATQVLVRDYISSRKGRFWTMMMQMASGRRYWDMGDHEVRQFWESRAHYNYIQEPVGRAPRIRPTHAMWQKAEEPFYLMLNEVRPTHIIVFGRALWAKMSRRFRDRPGLDVDGRPMTIREYHYADEQRAFAICVDHPSSGRASVARAYSTVSALLRA